MSDLEKQTGIPYSGFYPMRTTGVRIDAFEAATKEVQADVEVDLSQLRYEQVRSLQMDNSHFFRTCVFTFLGELAVNVPNLILGREVIPPNVAGAFSAVLVGALGSGIFNYFSSRKSFGDKIQAFENLIDTKLGIKPKIESNPKV